MSDRDLPGGPEPDVLVCAFAVTRTPPDTAAPDTAAGHEEGGPLRVLRAGELSLVVQDVPAALFGREALTERLNRPDELERCARAHHRAVEAAYGAGRGPVVPLPLATLYRGDRGARAALARREAQLGALLDRLRHRTEWVVKVHAADRAPRSPGGPAPDGAAAGGRAYLSRASSRHRDRQDAHGRALAAAEAVDASLRAYAVAAVRHRPQDERLTGRSAPQLLNAAYLVDDAERARFTAALARLTADGPCRGARVEASGPWIPYSFARWEDPPGGPGAGHGPAEGTARPAHRGVPA
ncbi:GvpL/GvpF family gas vesicle protein [Streptomyces sp. enrichment culture]|uniref:GvpL/GvpF family gas vesicle protein n=1 Tax=Streptomyces sp. enrichment culture TaxID=1795815 RepID=UPI003F563A5D